MACGGANAISREDVVEQECVKAYESAKSMSRTNKLQRGAIVLTVSGSILYLAYRVLNHKSETDRETGTLLHPSFATLGWWYKIGVLSRDLFIAMACADGGIMCARSFLKSFFHSGDLQWFVTTHANIYETYKQLERLRGKEGDYIESMRCMYAQALFKELVAIDGFIRYKIEQLYKQGDRYAQQLETRLKRSITHILYMISDQQVRDISKEWEFIDSVCINFAQWEYYQMASLEDRGPSSHLWME